MNMKTVLQFYNAYNHTALTRANNDHTSMFLYGAYCMSGAILDTINDSIVLDTINDEILNMTNKEIIESIHWDEIRVLNSIMDHDGYNTLSYNLGRLHAVREFLMLLEVGDTIVDYSPQF